jgi:hypothetical protein
VIRARTGLGTVALALVAAGAASATDVAFYHVEANAGSSAGGHAALRIGDRVFDFQNHAYGTLRLRRTDADHFRYVYSVLDNRSIRVARLDLSPEAAERVLERFNRRHLIQNKHFAVQTSLERDALLVAELAEGGAGERWTTDAVPGAGFFAPGSGPSPTIEELRRRIEAAHGTGFLEDQRLALEREAAALRLDDASDFDVPIDPDRIPATPASFSDRYLTLASALVATRTLLEAPALRAEALHAGGMEGPSLDVAQRRGLARYRSRLVEDLVALAASHRPDRGEALLLGVARLAAIDRSLASGRLVVLDAFPEDAYRIEADRVRSRRAFLSELEAVHRDEVDLAWKNLIEADAPIEPDYAWLETATNRREDIRRGLAANGPIRIHGDRLQPRGLGTASDLPRPTLGPGDLDAAQTRRDAHERRLREAFGYALLDHNCATEIFATLEAEFPGEESRRYLGGHITPGASLNYIPTVAFDTVVATYRVAEIGEIPSYRRARIEAQSATHPLVVGLRESTTLTSSFYRRNPHDTFFVFFTQDAPVLRPVLGAFNLAAATGELALGVLRAPFDRGAMAWSGLKGFATSLPELVFVNLRKGHMDYAPGDDPRTSYRTVAAR